MADFLTFMAEEVGRAAALIWGGIGVAVRLNYEVMSVVVTATARTIQLLLLLTQKAADLLSIIANDTALFLGDVGSGMIAVSKTIQSLFSGISCSLYVLGSSSLSAIQYINALIGSLYCYFINGIIVVAAQFGNFVQLIKYGFILFGSSVLFAISLLPNLIYLLSMAIVQLLGHVYLKGCLTIQYLLFYSRHLSQSTSQSVIDFFTDIPLQAILGVGLGILIIIGMKYLLQYTIDNLISIPNFTIPSLLTNAQRWLLRWYIRIWREANAPLPIENGEEEEIIDDASDVNGNDNNDNVPDLNVHPPVNVENVNHLSNVERRNAETTHRLPIVDRRILVGRRIITPGLEMPGPSQNNSRVIEDYPSSVPISPILARPPLSRRHNVLGLAKDVTEDEVLETFGVKSIIENSQQSKNSEWAKQLYRELENEREGKLCVICQDRPKRVILLPCRHLCLCESCRSAVITRDNNCPICRRPVMETLRVYL